MRREEIFCYITDMLEDKGLDQKDDDGWTRTVLTKGALKWEAALGIFGHKVMIYGCFPHKVKDRAKAYEACNMINAKTEYGQMYIQRDDYAVYRTTADMSDVYDAHMRLKKAFDDNIKIITQFWNEFSEI